VGKRKKGREKLMQKQERKRKRKEKTRKMKKLEERTSQSKHRAFLYPQKA
jgi:hypothetical protein